MTPAGPVTRGIAPSGRRALARALVALGVIAAFAGAWQPPTVPDATPPSTPVDESVESVRERHVRDGGAGTSGRASEARDGSACPAHVLAATTLAGFPGDARAARSTWESFNRTVDVYNRTAAFALALAPVLREPLAFADVVNVTEEHRVVCAVDVTVALDRGDVVSALALGMSVPRGAVADLAGDASVFVAVERTTTRNVSLDRDVVLAAIAVGGAGLSVEDVMDVSSETRTTTVVVRAQSLDEGNALALLALSQDASG